MESNNLSDGEELSKEACFNLLCITFKYYLKKYPEKNRKFRSLTEYIVNKGIIWAVRYSKNNVVFFYNKNLISKSDSYDLLSNIYSRFFAGILSMNTFIYIGCGLFDCYGKKQESICRALKRHKDRILPATYTKFF
jgi:hypothetical protein